MIGMIHISNQIITMSNSVIKPASYRHNWSSPCIHIQCLVRSLKYVD